MERTVHFSQISPVEMRVDRGGGHGGVAEQLLHDSEIRPALQQMRGERMAQGMRMNARRARAAARPADPAPRRAAGRDGRGIPSTRTAAGPRWRKPAPA